MRRRLGFGLILSTAAFGALGAVLRRWQVDSAFEVDSGLLTPGKPATVALVAALAIAALALLGMSVALFRGGAGRGYLANLAAPNLVLGALTIGAGAMLFAAGVLGVRDFALHMDERIVRMVLGLCLIPTGVCVGLVGLLGQQRQEGKGRFSGVLLAPGYCACLWLVVAYQGHTANPNVMEYVFLLLGIVCVIFFCYGAASCAFEKPRPILCAFSAAMGVTLLATAAADGGRGMDQLALWGFGLYLLTQLVSLVWCRVAPPRLEEWTPPPEEEAAEEQEQPRGEEDE